VPPGVGDGDVLDGEPVRLVHDEGVHPLGDGH
jgi:hypothetical protein